MLIKDIIGYDTYQFNQYIHELAAVLQNDTQTIVLCNLLNKYCNYCNGEIQTHTNGKQYHFFHSQKDIFTNELFIKKDKYENAIKQLNEKCFISSFKAKQQNNKLIDITYFYINVEKIKEAFKQGYSIIHKTEPKQSLEAKQQQSTKKQTNNTVSKLTTQQQADLKKIETDYKSKLITEQIYNIRKERILNNNNVK